LGGGEGDLAAEAALLQREVEGRLAGVELEDGALIIYTSGTTGNPKGSCWMLRAS
jgi:long-subunit acyl-CoA synthetase (AMP-forming)